MEIIKKILPLNDSGEVYYEGKLYKFPILDDIAYYLKNKKETTPPHSQNHE